MSARDELGNPITQQRWEAVLVQLEEACTKARDSVHYAEEQRRTLDGIRELLRSLRALLLPVPRTLNLCGRPRERLAVERALDDIDAALSKKSTGFRDPQHTPFCASHDGRPCSCGEGDLPVRKEAAQGVEWLHACPANPTDLTDAGTVGLPYGTDCVCGKKSPLGVVNEANERSIKALRLVRPFFKDDSAERIAIDAAIAASAPANAAVHSQGNPR